MEHFPVRQALEVELAEFARLARRGMGSTHHPQADDSRQ